MIKNYLKIAWVNLFRNKGFSLINILGLSTGMTCAIFILLWVNDELTFDKGHSNYNTIYQVIANRNFDNQVYTDHNLVFPLAKSLETGYPQVKNAVVTAGSSHVFSFGDKRFKKSGMTASEHFFEIFTYNFIKGNAETAIHDQRTIVLTESMALSLFGQEDAIGKILAIDKGQQAKVTAIISDPPKNSSFAFDYIEPYAIEFYNEYMQEWRNSFSSVYVQTTPNADIKTLNKNINDIIKKHDPKDNISTYFAFPMNKWHLESEFKDGINVGGSIEYVRLFSLIAIIILIIACINFMNLSTARSEKKAKEVGVRKTLGSSKKQLIFQFFSESLLITIIAFFISIIAVYFLIPSFNLFVDKNLHLDLNKPYFWFGTLSILIFTGLISGSYPALYLSSFKPIAVLKGINTSGKKALLPRRILVTSQFIISILLICATIIVYQQVQYTKDRTVGYNSENLIMISSSPDLDNNFSVVKQELLQTGSVEAVTRTSSPLTDIWWSSPSPDWNGKPKNGETIFTGLRVDLDFAKATGLKIILGKDFSGMPSDSLSMLLNKKAIETMGIKDPIGMQMKYGPTKYTVIGVVDDIVMESPYKPVSPLMIYFDGKHSEFINLRINNKLATDASLKKIEEVINKYNPAFPFEYQFVDEEFNKKFMNEELISKLATIFSMLAIFICCIGMAGLTSYTIEKRAREIGVRKILGASLAQLIILISNEFIKMVSIAFAISIPLTWLLMNKWLQDYAFHINISAWLFVIVGLLILGLTFLIVFFNTLKTANTNPTKSLRSE